MSLKGNVESNGVVQGNVEAAASLVGNVESEYVLTGTISKLEAIHGYSAYEVAIINGFKGTQEEWLESLKGEKGDKGDTGDTGEKGDRGETGESAYEVAMRYGYAGTEAEFYADLSLFDERATAAENSAANAAASETAAEAAKIAAEKARDAASEIAGGDFASKTEAQGYADTAESNAKSYTDTKIATIPTPDVSGQIATHNTSETAHSDIRQAIAGLTAADVGARHDTWMPTAADVGAFASSSRITDNGNIDTLKDGVYFYNGWAHNSVIHAVALPFTESFGLWIKKTLWGDDGGTSERIDTVINAATGDVYTMNGYDGNWGVNKAKPTAADVGALALDGSIAMTGNLQVRNGKVALEGFSNEGVIWFKSAGDLSNAACIKQYHNLDSTSSLKFSRYRDGEVEGQWNILHTGNFDTLIGGTKIQTGSYVGTGTSGSANPCSITLNFAPRIVVITSNTKDIGNNKNVYFNGLFFNGVKKYWFINQGQGSWTGTVNISGKTISWYDSAHNSQLNYYNAEYGSFTYTWWALG